MIYLNNKELNGLHIGDTEIRRVLLGEDLIWEYNPIVELGSGQSWDIKALYPNLYDRLTVDNFLLKSVNTASGANGITMRDTDTQREWAGFQCGIAKSYNPTTGALSVYNYVSPGNQADVSVVIVPKIEKLIYLGDGRSFNVRSYSNYADFTEDNFLILSSGSPRGGNYYYPQGYTYSDYGAATSTVPKSYDASTGVFTSGIDLVSRDTGGVYTYFNFTVNGNVKVYLNPKV